MPSIIGFIVKCKAIDAIRASDRRRNFEAEYRNNNADRSMLFIVMPSPPQAKIITNGDEILSIIDLLNHSNKFGSRIVIGMNSWIGQIRYNGQIYYISRGYSIVNNGIEYKIGREIITQLFEAYEKSMALEECFTDTVIEKFNGDEL